jgi:hypothetical protein
MQARLQSEKTDISDYFSTRHIRRSTEHRTTAAKPDPGPGNQESPVAYSGTLVGADVSRDKDSSS